ncbi:MAG: sugar ABC transporter substrate-binding protein [Solirubrobacteraceae bacterium]
MRAGRLWMLIGVVLSALTLAACGKSESTSAKSSKGEAAKGESTETSTSSSSSSKVASVPFEGLEQKVPTSYEEPKTAKLRLAYMNPSTGNQFLLSMGTAMKLATEKLGGSYTEVSAKEPNQQVTEMSQLIAEKVTGIAVFALDPKSLAPDVKKAKEAGIKLVTIDYDLKNLNPAGLEGFESQVWQGRDYGAYLTAKYMAEHLEPGASLGDIEFAIKVPSITYSIERDDYWAEKFGLKVLGATSNQTDDVAGGEQAMTQLLNKFPSIKGVMAYNDPSAIGAYAAARSAGTTGLLLAGENGASEARAAVKSGHETISAVINAPSIGKDWAWSLYDLAQGKKVPPTVAAEKPVLIDKENVESVPTWEATFKKEYGKSS